jgi:PBP1b-binding outer membrane lipoprotein LpoB
MVATTPEAVLVARVAALRARVRVLLAGRWAVRALLVVTLLAVVAALGMRWAGTPLPPEWLPPAFLTAAALGALWGWTRPVTSMDAARLADQRLGLCERLSSGIEFAARTPGEVVSPEETDFIQAQVADAAKHGAGLQPAAVFPWRVPREGRWLAGAAGVLLGVMLLPELPLFQSPRERAERAAMEREGKRLETIAREAVKRKELSSNEVSRRVTENMRRLGIQMQRGRVDKKRAMLAANRLTSELKEAQRQAAGPPPQKSLAQAAAELSQAASVSRPPSAGTEGQRALAAMAQALEKRDLEQAGASLKTLAEKLKSGQLSSREASEAAEALSRMSKSLEGTNLDAAAKQLAESAKQLEAARQLAAKLGTMSDAQLRELMAKAGDACAQAGGT